MIGQGTSPEAGVPDMTVISDIDELGINKNLMVRYGRDQIYMEEYDPDLYKNPVVTNLESTVDTSSTARNEQPSPANAVLPKRRRYGYLFLPRRIKKCDSADEIKSMFSTALLALNYHPCDTDYSTICRYILPENMYNEITHIEFSPDSRHMLLDLMMKGPDQSYSKVLFQYLPKLKNLLVLRLGRLDVEENERSDNLNKGIIHFPRKLRVFSASGSFVDDSLVRNLAKYCRELACISLSRSYVSPKCIESILQFKKLEELFISDSKFYFFDDHIAALLEGLAINKDPQSSLPKLRVIQCDNMSDSNIKFLVDNFPQLKGLYLANQLWLNIEPIHALHGLREFSLRDFSVHTKSCYCHFKEVDTHYLHPMYSLLTDVGSKLSYLKLETCATDVDLVRILRLCPVLKCLHLFIVSLQIPNKHDLENGLHCFKTIECISLDIGETWTKILLSVCYNLKRICVRNLECEILIKVLDVNDLARLEELTWFPNSSKEYESIALYMHRNCQNIRKVFGLCHMKPEYYPNLFMKWDKENIKHLDSSCGCRRHRS